VTEKIEEELESHSAEHLGLNAPSVEYLTALHAATESARQIPRTKPIPSKAGGEKLRRGARLEDLGPADINFYVPLAEDFTTEARRALLPQKLLATRLSTKIGAADPQTAQRKLTGTYLVAHAPSAQGMVYKVEWVSKNGSGDELAAAHTRMTRRFYQGLLQISVCDELEPESPPKNTETQNEHPVPGPCEHPVEAHWANEDGVVICRQCGEVLGTLAPGQAPPQGGAPFSPPLAQPPQVVPPPHVANQPRQPTQTTLPISEEPVVQAAHALLGPNSPPASAPAPTPTPAPAPARTTPVEGPPPTSMAAEHTPSVPATTSREAFGNGEPGTPEEWRDLLVSRGYDFDLATQVACYPVDVIADDDLCQLVSDRAHLFFNGDKPSIRAAWQPTGFVPNPGMPKEHRPRPTGIQVLRYLSQFDFNDA